jgi:hypothetical protein
MANSETTEKPVNLDTMSVEELESLIKQAQEYKRTKKTNPVLVKGYCDSVEKHINGTLVAIGKLLSSQGVAPERWKQVEKQLARLAPENRDNEARKMAQKFSRRVKQ